MGTMLQEMTMHSDHKKFNNRVKNKPRHAPSWRSKIPDMHSQNAEAGPEREDCLGTKNGHIKGRKRSARNSLMVTATSINPREVITKANLQMTSTNGLKIRSHRQNIRNGNQDHGKLPRSLPTSLISVPAPSPELAKLTITEQGKPKLNEDTDSGSDLSELERLPSPASNPHPPQLYLREEIINPQDLQQPRHPTRSRNIFSDSYPDFLPPPFNSWSLQQLAVYLNTDGKGIPRLRPVSQLERYLERLLQLEWFQIQTVHEESNKSKWAGRQGPRTSTHSNLSAPKSILHCQRAFPWALLSSLQPQSCNGACRLYTNSHHTHLSQLTEKSTKAHKPPRRSSSESRVHQFRPHHSHRLSDSLDGTNYIKNMQAIGNMRNPSGFTCNIQGASGNVTTEALGKKGSGGRSRSCGDVSKGEYWRMRHDKRTERHPKLLDAPSSDIFYSSKGKQKHVGFAIN